MAADFPSIRNFFDVFSKSSQLIEAVEKHPTVDIIYHFPTPKNAGRINSEGRLIPFPPEFINSTFDWCIAGSAALEQVRERLSAFAKHKKLTHAGNLISRVVCEVEALSGLRQGKLSSGDYLEFIRENLRRLTVALDTREKLDKLINGGTNTIFYGKGTPGDIDFFFLKSPVPNRMILPGVDLVHTKAETVEELLFNFDLPCCRAAYNSKRDYWISAQCLYAMMMGRYPLPNYTTCPIRFASLILENRNGDPLAKSEEFLVKRFAERTKKYQERGFIPYYVETNEVLPWIKNRFHYGEWKK